MKEIIIPDSFTIKELRRLSHSRSTISVEGDVDRVTDTAQSYLAVRKVPMIANEAFPIVTQVSDQAYKTIRELAQNNL